MSGPENNPRDDEFDVAAASAASSKCPVCLNGSPHAHDRYEIVTWLQAQGRSFGVEVVDAQIPLERNLENLAGNIVDEMLDRFIPGWKSMEHLQFEVRRLKSLGQPIVLERLRKAAVEGLGQPMVLKDREVYGDARAYAHKCIERVTEMRKLDLARAKEPNAVDCDYYLGRAHRCDDILFWLSEYESHIAAGLSATEDWWHKEWHQATGIPCDESKEHCPLARRKA